MGTEAGRVGVITNLLLGAAYADDTLEGREAVAVRDLLKKLLGTDTLPPIVNQTFEKFDGDSFDLAAAAKDFASEPAEQKRKVLELVAAVRDADDEIDLREDDYIRALGNALGMKPSEYADLTLEIEVLKDNFESLGKPPPPPTAAKKK